jgi:uncharacterized OB-fold protein
VTRLERPLPIPDEQSAPFWKAAAQGILTVARCSRCQSLCHPPDVVCPHCHSTDPAFAFTPVSGRGTVRSWTVMHQSFLPGFEEDVPFLLVDVELVEQPDLRIIGRLMDGPDAKLQIGDSVQVTFEDLGSDRAVPAFALEGDR